MGHSIKIKLTYLSKLLRCYDSSDMIILKEPIVNSKHDVDEDKTINKQFGSNIMDFINVIKTFTFFFRIHFSTNIR